MPRRMGRPHEQNPCAACSPEQTGLPASTCCSEKLRWTALHVVTRMCCSETTPLDDCGAPFVWRAVAATVAAIPRPISARTGLHAGYARTCAVQVQAPAKPLLLRCPRPPAPSAPDRLPSLAFGHVPPVFRRSLRWVHASVCDVSVCGRGMCRGARLRRHLAAIPPRDHRGLSEHPR